MFLLSKSFWFSHKRKALAIISSYALCAVAVVSSCLYFRGLKVTEAWEYYEDTGNCDMCFYDLSDEQLSFLQEDKRFSRFGTMIRAGYAEGETGTRVVVGSLADEQSVDMFYLPPEEGAYPAERGEVIIDRNSLAAMGVKPEVGAELTLSFYDFAGKELGTQTFTVSGIMEMEYFTSAGISIQQRQYPNYSQGDYDYSSPLIFLYWEDYREIFRNVDLPVEYHTVTYADINYETMGEADDYELFLKLSTQTPEFENAIIIGSIRSSVSNNVLGFQDFARDGNTWGYDAVSERISNGTKQPDFYSDILMPCYMSVLLIVTMVSSICLFQVVLAYRREHIKCYHMVGMTKQNISLMLLAEMAVMAIIGFIVGVPSGVLIYLGVYELLNQLGAGLYSAFESDIYINAVTFDPYVSAVVTVLVAYLGSIPVLLREMKQKKVQVSCQNNKEISGLFRILHKREKQWYGYQGTASAIIICVLALVLTFGYLVYRADTDNKNNENRNILELTEFPYMATKGTSLYGVFENLHSEGISPQDFENLIQNDMVENYYAKILNMSTVLSYSDISENKDVIEAFRSLENEMTAKPRYQITGEADEYTMLLAERFDYSLEHIGYLKSEVLFAAPTVGLPEEKIIELESYVTSGSIRIDALKKGEEVLFVIPRGSVVPVKASDVLPLSDVLLHDQAENSDLLNISSEAPEWAEIIRVDEWNGQEWPLYDCGGSRVDIPVKVGAIVELPEEMLEQYYCETLGGLQATFNLTTVGEAFSTWGLPDCNYTEVAIKTADEFDREAFEELWYQMIGASQDVSSVSQNQVYADLERVAVEQMRIYFALGMILCVIGCIGLVNAISLRTEQLLPKLRMLRSLGADKRKCYQYGLWVNLKALPIATGTILVVTVLLYGFAWFYKEYMVDGMNEKVGDFIWLNLYYKGMDYHPVIVVIIIFIFFAGVIGFTVSNVYLRSFRTESIKTKRRKNHD